MWGLRQCACTQSAVQLGARPDAPRPLQILVQLLDDAEAYTGGEVRKAIISVPAYFNTAQREATANAGTCAHAWRKQAIGCVSPCGRGLQCCVPGGWRAPGAPVLACAQARWRGWTWCA